MRTFNEILSTTFSIPESDIAGTLSSKDIPDWDSMNYLLFISELEKEFSISFSMDEVMNVQTVGDLRQMVERKTS